jgi:hypothetical protein
MEELPMMRRAVILVLVLGFTTSASAECSWVLWGAQRPFGE